jgi:hypothetical protein
MPPPSRSSTDSTGDRNGSSRTAAATLRSESPIRGRRSESMLASRIFEFTTFDTPLLRLVSGRDSVFMWLGSCSGIGLLQPHSATRTLPTTPYDRRQRRSALEFPRRWMLPLQKCDVFRTRGEGAKAGRKPRALSETSPRGPRSDSRVAAAATRAQSQCTPREHCKSRQRGFCPIPTQRESRRVAAPPADTPPVQAAPPQGEARSEPGPRRPGGNAPRRVDARRHTSAAPSLLSLEVPRSLRPPCHWA